MGSTFRVRDHLHVCVRMATGGCETSGIHDSISEEFRFEFTISISFSSPFENYQQPTDNNARFQHKAVADTIPPATNYVSR